MSSKETERIVERTVIRMAEMLGIGQTELSYSRANAKFGKFFRDMVNSGRLKPCRVGQGKSGTHWYSVRDIVDLKAEEAEKARLI